MIKLPFNNDMIYEAAEKARKLGSIKNSITSGRGSVAGYLAEMALSEYLGAENISCDKGRDKYSFDLISEGSKIEVKTKRRTVDPEPHHEVSVASTSEHQRPDFYSFVSLTFERKVGSGKTAFYTGLKNVWLCGFISRDEFFECATFIPKGTVDNSNGFVCHQDMYNLPIKSLKLYENLHLITNNTRPQSIHR
jgi:hypothetical protein